MHLELLAQILLSFHSLRAGFSLTSASQTAICSSSLSCVPQAHPLHLVQLELSFTRSISSNPSVYAFILAFPVKVLSMIVLIGIRHCVALSLFHVMPAPHNLGNLQCVRELRWPQTRNEEFSKLNLRRSFNHNPWLWWSRSFFVSCDFLVNFNPVATICHGMPHRPSQFVDSHASLSVRLLKLLPRTTPFLVMLKTASRSIMMTDKDSLSHAARKWKDTVFSNFTKPNFLSNFAPLAFSIFDHFI